MKYRDVTLSKIYYDISKTSNLYHLKSCEKGLFPQMLYKQD